MKRINIKIALLCVVVLGLSMFSLTACRLEPDEILTLLITDCTKEAQQYWSFDQILEHAREDRDYSAVIELHHRTNYNMWVVIYQRTINVTRRTVEHRHVPFHSSNIDALGDIRMIANEYIGMTENGLLFPRQGRQVLFDEIITVFCLDGNRRPIPGMEINIRVFREPIPVQSVIIFSTHGNNEIPINQIRHMERQVYPLNASFPSVYFQVESLVINDQIMTGEKVQNYVQLGGGHLARVEIMQGLNPGDKINVVATTRFEGVRSNVFTFIVVA